MTGGSDAEDEAEVIHQLIALAVAGELDAGELADLEELLADRPAARADYERMRAARPAAPTTATAAAAGPATDRDDAATRRRRRLPGWLVPLGVGLAFFAIVATVGIRVRSGDSDSDSPADRTAAVLDDPDQRVIPFGGGLGGLSLIYSPGTSAAIVSGTDIAVPDPGARYVVWRHDADGDVVQLVDFVPDDGGAVDAFVPDVDDITTAARFTVTVEDGPASIPTGSELVSVTPPD